MSEPTPAAGEPLFYDAELARQRAAALAQMARLKCACGRRAWAVLQPLAALVGVETSYANPTQTGKKVGPRLTSQVTFRQTSGGSGQAVNPDAVCTPLRCACGVVVLLHAATVDTLPREIAKREPPMT